MLLDKVKTMTTRNDKRDWYSQKEVESEHGRSQGKQRVVAVNNSGGGYYQEAGAPPLFVEYGQEDREQS